MGKLNIQIKKFWASLSLALLLFIVYYYNQSVLPRIVEERFKVLYPTVQEYQWESKIGKFEFEFYIDGRRQLALLNFRGDLLQLFSEIDPNLVPAQVLDSLHKTYPFFSIKAANEIKIDDSTTFELQIMRENTGWDLFYSDNGKIVNKEKTPVIVKKDIR